MGDPENDGWSKNCPAGLDPGSEQCDIMCVIRANLIFSDEARGGDTFIGTGQGGVMRYAGWPYSGCSKKLSLDNTHSGKKKCPGVRSEL